MKDSDEDGYGDSTVTTELALVVIATMKTMQYIQMQKISGMMVSIAIVLAMMISIRMAMDIFKMPTLH